MRVSAVVLNPALSRTISEMGHTELLVVADAGLPIPRDSARIDLALRPGVPSFIDVLDTVLAELVVEGATVAEETAAENPAAFAALESRLRRRGVSLVLLPHAEFKRLSTSARAFVRSGECSPFANVILHAGVSY